MSTDRKIYISQEAFRHGLRGYAFQDNFFDKMPDPEFKVDGAPSRTLTHFWKVDILDRDFFERGLRQLLSRMGGGNA